MDDSGLMNDTLRNIQERYSCRSFKDTLPSAQQLEAITKAALQAPSGRNRQSWQVIVVTDQQLIAEIDQAGLDRLASMEDQSNYQRILMRGGTLFYHAPCAVVLAVKATQPAGSELIDLGIIAQNVVLAATSLGLASLHCGYARLAFDTDKGAYFKERLKFPEGYECGLVVLLGYAEKPGKPHRLNPSKITYIQ